MSAYIVDPELIAKIAAAALACLESEATRDGTAVNPDAWANIVADLCQQNAASVAYRYDIDQEEAVVSFAGMHPRIWQARALRRPVEPTPPAALYEACRCYAYQSSEHPGWEASSAAKMMELLKQSAGAAADAERGRAIQQAAAAREQDRTNLRDWIAANRPAGAKAAIIAEFHESQCDSQSDYYGSRIERSLFLGWSSHTQDRFAEMRKAAATNPETAFLGPGCGQYTPQVVFVETIRSNGSYYHDGQHSPWHRDMEPEAPLTTRQQAEDWITSHGAPESIGVDGTRATFTWAIADESIEHREKYSMGRGYYLGARYQGWQVRKLHLA